MIFIKELTIVLLHFALGRKNSGKSNNNSDRNEGKANRQKTARPKGNTTARIVLIGVIAGIAALVAAAIYASGGFTNKFVANDPRSAFISQALTPTTQTAYALGDNDAKVTIVEFGDYQCNSCGRFHKESKNQVISDLVNTGKAKFMFKDFNINDYVYSPREGSTLASEAAYCAGDQGKFWQYYDELYNKQQREGVEWISMKALNQFAVNVGIQDIDSFSSCLNSHQYRDAIKSNYKLAQNLGLNATPTFLILADGKAPQIIVGAHPYSSFQAVVEQMSD